MIYSPQISWLPKLLKSAFLLLALGQLWSCTDAQDGANLTSHTPTMSTEDNALAGLHLASARLHAPAPGQPVSAGYFTLMNHGVEAVTLVGVESTQAKVQMHTTRTEGAGTSMRPLEKVTIEPDQQTVFRPGGHHLMIRDIDQAAFTSSYLSVELVFADDSRLPAALEIVPMGEWMQGSPVDHSMH